ncbi:MAG: cysteine dioxygenase family protein [Crocinitomicaceae bacterium]
MNSNGQDPLILESLDELVTALTEAERTKYGDIIGSLKLKKSALEDFCSWSSESYTRNCITENDKFELILLCWEKGQITPIHDHGGEECWVKVIQGEFREVISKMDKGGELNVVKSTISKSDDISYMIDFMGFHSLENMSNKRSMSLHLYAKPIRNCNLFDEKTGKFVNKDLVYDTVSSFLTN